MNRPVMLLDVGAKLVTDPANADFSLDHVADALAKEFIGVSDDEGLDPHHADIAALMPALIDAAHAAMTEGMSARQKEEKLNTIWNTFRHEQRRKQGEK
ncbi:MAG TPA: hypothetical protein VMD77_05570 [Candidatus Baltobacteraceae bacterium]|nr:hypothetical protein [Candidatus Baltobacteraceae bacterium]